LIYVSTIATTTAMKKLFQKHQILESLNNLDQAQTEQVIAYIKGIVDRKAEQTRYEGFSRNQAMMQIRQALKRTRSAQSF
jgi:hypothetical protein